MGQGGYVQTPGNSQEFFLVLPYLPDSLKGSLQKPHPGKSTKISDPSEAEEKNYSYFGSHKGKRNQINS